MSTLTLRQKPKRLYWSLSAKLTVTYSVLILLIAGVLAGSLYLQAFNRQREIIKDRLHDVLNFSLPLVSGTYHSLIASSADENRTAYNVVLTSLRSIRSASSIIQRVYTLRQNPDGSLVYVIDSTGD